MSCALPAILGAILLLVCQPRAHAGPFDFDGSPAREAVLTLGAECPTEWFDSPMANRLLGVVAVLGPAELRPLVIPSRRASEVGWPSETEIIGHAHVSQGDQHASFRMGVTPDGITLFASVPDGPVYALDAGLCAVLLDPLRGYAGGFEPESASPRGEIVPLADDAQPSPILLDGPTIEDRLNAGRNTELPPTGRYLPDEQLLVRLPLAYSPRRPAGLLVWIDAGPSGRPPEVFNEAADAMNLIMVGAADAGNPRLVTDRYQLALDAVASVTHRFHVDPRRVYVAGISGGGRVSSALVACFPDIFTGAVPIVGLNCYEHVPLGDGRFVPLGFRKPDARRWKLLREHRIAAMSGDLDFNFREITNAVRIYRRDGIGARLFEYEDMSHTLPTPERFIEAIGWVDEPVAEGDAGAAEDAAQQLDAYLARFDELPVTTDAQRRILCRITHTAPWSDPAWRACELLGVIGGSEDEGDPTGTP